MYTNKEIEMYFDGLKYQRKMKEKKKPTFEKRLAKMFERIRRNQRKYQVMEQM